MIFNSSISWLCVYALIIDEDQTVSIFIKHIITCIQYQLSQIQLLTVVSLAGGGSEILSPSSCSLQGCRRRRLLP